MSASDSVAVAPKRIEFEDLHAGIGNLQEAEVTRVRVLQGGWRWALVVATAATILLCINQQFSLRFFIGYTQLNTEYFYLLILLMLPFTFVIFPGTASAPLERVSWYDALLFAVPLVLPALVNLALPYRLTPDWTFPNWPLLPIVLYASLALVIGRFMPTSPDSRQVRSRDGRGLLRRRRTARCIAGFVSRAGRQTQGSEHDAGCEATANRNHHFLIGSLVEHKSPPQSM